MVFIHVAFKRIFMNRAPQRETIEAVAISRSIAYLAFSYVYTRSIS